MFNLSQSCVVECNFLTASFTQLQIIARGNLLNSVNCNLLNYPPPPLPPPPKKKHNMHPLLATEQVPLLINTVQSCAWSCKLYLANMMEH